MADLSFLAAHYKSILTACRRARPIHWLIVAVVATSSATMIFSSGDARPRSLTDRLAAGATVLPLALPDSAFAQPAPPAEPAPAIDVVTVKSGDSLAAIFSRAGLSAADLAQIMALGKATAPLRNLYPGDQLRFARDPHGALVSLDLVLPDNSRLTVRHDGERYTASRKVLPVLQQVVVARGTIRGSLFGAAMEAGLSNGLTMELIHLFAWDIDFAHDVRPGDSFTVLYEHTYSARDGSGDGAILAAAFHANDRLYTAIRYTDADGRTGYYTVDGHNVRKAFLRAPVEYSRVSSNFSRHRMNPVLHYVRPHLGTDFAAPEGTPIHATAGGRIIFRGRKGGYGNAVILKHFGHYSTLYGHMSRFARGEHVGSRVHQGEVIGYVGHTGVATGPHVHYEFRIDGVHHDPLSVKLPAANPIARKYRHQFEAYAGSLLDQLKGVDGTEVAVNAN